jgi:hypothetical protein
MKELGGSVLGEGVLWKVGSPELHGEKRRIKNVDLQQLKTWKHWHGLFIHSERRTGHYCRQRWSCRNELRLQKLTAT